MFEGTTLKPNGQIEASATREHVTGVSLNINQLNQLKELIEGTLLDFKLKLNKLGCSADGRQSGEIRLSKMPTTTSIDIYIWSSNKSCRSTEGSRHSHADIEFVEAAPSPNLIPQLKVRTTESIVPVRLPWRPCCMGSLQTLVRQDICQ